MGRSRPFLWLTKAERRLWEAYPTGAWVDLRGGRDHAPASDGSRDRTRSVRAKVIAALLLGVRENEPGQVPGIRLAGARIIGDLNLSDASIDAKIHLLNCQVEGITLLAEADRRRGRRSRRGDELLKWDGPESWGEPRSWETAGLWAGGLTVDGGAFLRQLHSTGGLRLIGARFNSGLYLQGAVINAGGAHAVYADHLKASAAEFSRGFTAIGTVRLRGARIGGVLSFHNATLKARDRALHLSHMQVDELFLLPETVEGEVNLGYSRLGVLFDRPERYPEHVQLNGLTFETLREHGSLTARLALLRRDPNGYRPQPYEQLATYYRRIGHEPDARRVLLAKQRARRRTLRLPGQLWGRLLDVAVGYGYRPWLAGLWVTILLAAGTAVFSQPQWLPRQIGLDETRHFNAFTYTLDLLVPVSVFEQRGAWEPVGWTQWLANGLIAAGWILATALIAGGTRVLRASNSA